jgi:glycosyltransferase involved in cell wall biosynthesis
MKISIVIPLYNSAKFQPLLLEAIDKERFLQNWDLEVIFIDDGSKDGSFEVAVANQKKYPFLRAIKLARNFGHQAAVRTGLDYAKGDVIAIIDDDLQDPPSVLKSFLDKIDEGWDVVYGVRKKRKESFLKRSCYKIFYRVLSSLSEIEIPLDTGDFCVMKREVVEKMLSLPEKNPFLRGIRAWVGYKQIGLEYERAARVEGESGYTFKKLFKLAFDGIFSFSLLPLRFITFLGVIGFSFSLIYTTYVIWKYITYGFEVKGFATIAILLVFFSSLILICLGIIGEYIARIYTESKNRPISVIMKTHNL